VEDGFGGTDTAQVYFTITPRNDPPIVESPIADTTLAQNSGLVFIAKLNNVFADVDLNDMPLENFSVGSDNEIVIPSLAGDSLYLAAPSGASGIDTIRVIAIDDSVASAEDVFVVNVLVPASVEDEPSSVPQEFTVYANYPNPFNPSTKIRYYLPKRSQVTVTVFDIAGGLITTLVNDYQGPGLEEVGWNAVDQQGNSISSGVYLYRVEAAGRIETRKMIYIK
ncbi:MAG: T9SS type A sorting domain-containing protein, partial [Calditrichota bacterium]